MSSSRQAKIIMAAWLAAGVLLCAGVSRTARAQNPTTGHEPVAMVVVVKESDTGEPVSQAHITLQFTEPHGPAIPRKGKKISYNSKTDSQGRCKFTAINKGPIVLVVTAPGHQSYGKDLQLENENQVFEVKLKKPQPLI